MLYVRIRDARYRATCFEWTIRRRSEGETLAESTTDLRGSLRSFAPGPSLIDVDCVDDLA